MIELHAEDPSGKVFGPAAYPLIQARIKGRQSIERTQPFTSQSQSAALNNCGAV